MFRFSLDAKGLGCDKTIIVRLHIKFGCHPTKKTTQITYGYWVNNTITHN